MNTTVIAFEALLAELAKHTPEHLATLVEDTDSYGRPDDDAATAVGNYIALRLLIATSRPMDVWVQYHNVIVIDMRTREILARGEMTGGLADLHDLITEENPEFVHLHDAAGVDAARSGAADRAEEASNTPLWERTTDTDSSLRP